MTIWAFIPLITFLTYLALLILTVPSLERRVNRVFALYLGAAAIWSFASFMLHINLFPEQALYWNELLPAALVWTLLAYYHFIRAYCNKRAGMGVVIGYALVALLLGLSLGGFIVKFAHVENGVLHHDLGVSLYFIGAIALTVVGAGLYQLIRRYRSSPDAIERNRTGYLLAGWSILVIFGYSNLVPAWAGLPLDHFGSLANAVIVAYAIHRYQLLDLKRVLRRGLVYSSLTIIFTAQYLLLLLILQEFFTDWTAQGGLALAALLAVLVALLFNPLRNLIQNWIDRLFYRETYDYRQMLLSLSDQISNVLDLGDVAQSILVPIVEAMHAKQAALLFPQIESGDFDAQFVQQAGKGTTSVKLRFAGDNPIVTWLTTEGKTLRRELIDVIPQLKGLWEKEKAVLDELELALLCPIRSKGRLSGILAVGAKKSGIPYSDEEIDLLMTMANEAAVAIENARMLDSLRIEQLRVKRLLEQVSNTQEEERKRISADLHDSVAQWLAAASYRAQTVNALLSRGGVNDKARDELDAMESTIDKSLKELRRVVIALRPPALEELGLNHALKQSLEELQAVGVECRFSRTGESFRLPLDVEIAVYRVVQEAVNNIRKHAKATQASLHLQYREDRLQVQVRDNGRGFDLSRTLDSAISVGHMGLLGMKERVEALGGDVKIRTSQDGGTLITLSFPIQSPVEEK
ncbi:MAG: hypothetical protein HYX80_06855 [Chloroflexi bacterium]|nr:hypothetical protein [Chloroflexota bacterium]